MSVDLISNMLSSVRNASVISKGSIEVPYSKMSESVAKVLKEAGFLTDVKVFKESGVAYKKLRLDVSPMKISKVVRESKPGNRSYKGAQEIHKVAGGYGLMIVSTNRGVMRSEEAKKRKLGGEVICRIW